MAKVGYARVSSVGQSLDVQREKLGGCDKLFEEKRSGTTDARPMLKQCLGYVREGDQLIVTRIDRLARSTLHLCQIAETLRKKGVDLVVLDQNIDTSDATGRLLFNMLGAIGQFETQIRAVRQMAGIKKAKDRGDHRTRPATFRRDRPGGADEVSCKVLLLAKELKLVKVGLVIVDGSKFEASASKHRSVTYERAGELIDQLKLESRI